MAFALENKIFCGVSPDWNYGPWASVAAYMKALQAEFKTSNVEVGTTICIEDSITRKLTEMQYNGAEWVVKNQGASIDVDEIKVGSLNVETVDGVKKLVIRNRKGNELGSVKIEEIGGGEQVTYGDPIVIFNYGAIAYNQIKAPNNATYKQSASNGDTKSGLLASVPSVIYTIVETAAKSYVSVGTNGELTFLQANSGSTDRSFTVAAQGTINGVNFTAQTTVKQGHMQEEEEEQPNTSATIRVSMLNVGHFAKLGNVYTTDRDYGTDTTAMDADKEEYRNLVKAANNGQMPDVLGICEYNETFAMRPIVYADSYVFPEYTNKFKSKKAGFFYNAILSKGMTITKQEEIQHVGTTAWPYGVGISNPQYRAFLVNEMTIAGKKIAFVVQHLEPTNNDWDHFRVWRKPQMEELAAWIEAGKSKYDGIVIMGDWNSVMNQIRERFAYGYDGDGKKKTWYYFNWGNINGDGEYSNNYVYPLSDTNYGGMKKYPYPNHNLGMTSAIGKTGKGGIWNGDPSLGNKCFVPKNVNGKKSTSVTELREPDITFVDNILVWGDIKVTDVKYAYNDVNGCDHPAIGCTITIGGGGASGGGSEEPSETPANVKTQAEVTDMVGYHISPSMNGIPKPTPEGHYIDLSTMIDVTGCVSFTTNYEYGLVGAMFDANGNNIGTDEVRSIMYQSGVETTKKNMTKTIPSGVKYVRLNIPTRTDAGAVITDWQVTLNK